jgi:peptide/nickel transport system permease protein
VARWLTVVRRSAFAVAVVWVVVSLAWASIALTPDPNEASAVRSININDQLTESEKEAAIERIKGDSEAPPLERYLDWAGDFATLDWGTATSQQVPGPDGEPTSMAVTEALSRGIPRTLSYVVPAIALSVLLGWTIGTYAALAPESRAARLASMAAYAGGGLPNFYLAVAIPVVLAVPLDLLGSGLPAKLGPFGVRTTILPIAVLTLGLVGTQIRFTRTEVLEYARAEFVRLVRAKGAGPLRLARHVLRNAALPLLALFFTEVLAVLVVDVFVLEYVFPVEGIGAMALDAIFARDLSLVVGVTAVVVGTGVFGTLLQDLSYLYLDPRVGDE